MANPIDMYGPYYGGFLDQQNKNQDRSAQNTQQGMQALGILSQMARQQEQNKLLAEQVNMAKLKAVKEGRMQDMMMRLAERFGRGGGSAPMEPTGQMGLLREPDPMTGEGALPMPERAPAQTGTGAGAFPLSPTDIAMGGILGMPGMDTAGKMFEASRPKIEFHGGQAMDMRNVNPGTVVPQTNQQGFSTMTIRDPNAPGGYRVVTTPGGPEAYQTQQDIAEGARARRDLVTVPPTSPTTPPTYSTREKLVNDIDAGPTQGQMQVTSPDVRSAERTAIDLFNSGVRNFRVDAGPAGARSSGVAAGMSPSASAEQKAREQEVNAFGQELGKAGAEISKAADSSRDRITQIGFMRQALSDIQAAGGDAGKLAPAMQNLSAWAQAVGVDPSKLGLPAGAGPYQVMDAITRQMAVTMIGSGGIPANNFSEADRKFVERMMPMVTDTPQGLSAKAKVLEAVAQRNIEAERSLLAARSQGKSISEWRQEWSRYAQANPIFAGEQSVRGSPSEFRVRGAPTAREQQPVPGLQILKVRP